MYKHNEYLFNFILMDNHIMISDYFSVFLSDIRLCMLIKKITLSFVSKETTVKKTLSCKVNMYEKNLILFLWIW